MELFYKCNQCRALNKIRIRANDRVEIRELYPLGMPNRCSYCQHDNKVEPNKVIARESKFNAIVMILGIIMSVLVGVFLLKKYWTNDLGRDLYVLAVLAAVISLPPLILGLFVKSDRESVKLFNSYYV